MTALSNNNPKARIWTLYAIRKLIGNLIRNRKTSWQKAGFKVQSKLTALENFNTQFEAAQNWGWDGHIKLLYNYRESIRDIIPGENSRYQGLRTEMLDFMERLENYYINEYAHATK